MDITSRITFTPLDQDSNHKIDRLISPPADSPGEQPASQAAGTGPRVNHPAPESKGQSGAGVVSKQQIGTHDVDTDDEYELKLTKLKFSKDEQTGKMVVKVIDKNTDKVIRQVPPQDFLDMVHQMRKAADELLKRLPKTI